MAKDYEEVQLENGLRVALKRTPFDTIFGMLRVHHGALHEKPGEEGLAHLLEHVIATGGSQKYSPEQMQSVRERFGMFNASTGLDHTRIYADLLSKDVGQFLDFAAQGAFYPRFDPVKFEEEKNRVLRELGDELSLAHHGEMDEARSMLIGKGPHSYSILGKESVIREANIDGLRAFHSRGYHANNADLILVGGLPSNAVELVETYFGNAPCGEGKPYIFPSVPELTKKEVIHIDAPHRNNKDNTAGNSASFWLGLRVPSERSEEYASMLVLSQLIGGDSSSRLFKSISQEKGLAYRIGTSYRGENNLGTLTINGSVAASKIEDALNEVFTEFSKLKEAPCTDAELERLKRLPKYFALKERESNLGCAGAIVKELDGGIGWQELAKRIDSVTADDLQNAAQKYLPSDRERGKYVLFMSDPLKGANVPANIKVTSGASNKFPDSKQSRFSFAYWRNALFGARKKE